MTDKVIENNQVIIMGEIISDFQFSHEIFGEGFYMVDVNVPRLSDSCDVIPLMVSDRLIDVNEDIVDRESWFRVSSAPITGTKMYPGRD